MTTQHRREKLQVVGQMAAAVAHDLNNLLPVILSHGRTPGKGTGLGLATVRDIVESAGGCVELESVERIGTTVRVLLPVQGGAGTQ